MLWHCFSSTVIVPRKRSTPPSFLLPAQNPGATASTEWGEQLGHHHSFSREGLTFLWKLQATQGNECMPQHYLLAPVNSSAAADPSTHRVKLGGCKGTPDTGQL